MRRFLAFFMTAIMLVMNVNVYGAETANTDSEMQKALGQKAEEIRKNAQVAVEDAEVSGSSIDIKALSAEYNDVVYIYDKEQLKAINGMSHCRFELMKDIDISGEEWTPLDIPYCIFNGNGHTISGLTMSNFASKEYEYSNAYAGFLYGEDNGVTTKLNLTNINIDITASSLPINSRVDILSKDYFNENSAVLDCKVQGRIKIDTEAPLYTTSLYVSGITGGTNCDIDMDFELSGTFGYVWAYGLYDCNDCTGNINMDLSNIHNHSVGIYGMTECVNCRSDINFDVKNNAELDSIGAMEYCSNCSANVSLNAISNNYIKFTGMGYCQKSKFDGDVHFNGGSLDMTAILYCQDCVYDGDIDCEYTLEGENKYAELSVCGIQSSQRSSCKSNISCKNNTSCDDLDPSVTGISGSADSSFEGNIDINSPSKVWVSGIKYSESKNCYMKGNINVTSMDAGVTGISGCENSYMEGDINVVTSSPADLTSSVGITGVSGEYSKRKGNISVVNRSAGGTTDITGIYGENCYNWGNMNVKSYTGTIWGIHASESGNYYAGNINADISAFYEVGAINNASRDSGFADCFVGNINTSIDTITDGKVDVRGVGDYSAEGPAVFNGVYTMNYRGRRYSVSNSDEVLYFYDCKYKKFKLSRKPKNEYECPYEDKENFDRDHYETVVLRLVHGPAGYSSKPPTTDPSSGDEGADGNEKTSYSIFVFDTRTNGPLAGASINLDGKAFVTDEEGIANVEAAQYISKVTVSYDGKVVYDDEDRWFLKDRVNDLYIEDFTFNKEDIDFGNSGSANIKGPTLKIMGKEFSVFDLPFNLDLCFDTEVNKKRKNKVFKYIKVAYDREKQEYQAVVTTGQAEKDFMSDASEDGQGKTEDATTPEWKKSFNELVSAYRSKDSKKVKNLFKAENSKFGFEGEMTGAAYFTFGLDGQGGWMLKEGGGIFTVSAEASGSVPLPPAPYVFVSYGASGEADAKFGCEFSKNKDDSINIQATGNIDLSASLYGGIGIGMRKVLSAEAGAEGTLDAGIKFPVTTMPESVEASLTAKIYVAVTLLCFGGKVDREFYKYQMYPNSPTNAIIMSLADDEDDLKLIGRSYQDGIMPLSTDDITFKSSVYPYGGVETVYLDDGSMLMVWLDDDADRSLINKTALYYAVYKDGAWSEPQQVCDDGTADFDFSLCRCENSVFMVWQNEKTQLSDNADIDTVAHNIDIYYSVFKNGSWKEPINITPAGNSDYEYMPVVNYSNYGSHVMAGWLSNDADSVFVSDDIPESIYKAELEHDYDRDIYTVETVTEAVGSLPVVNELAIDSKGKAVYITDADTEPKLYSDGSPVETSGASIGGLYVDNDGKLMYTQDGMAMNEKGLPCSTKEYNSDRLKYVSSNNNKAVIYEVQEGITKSNLYGAVCYGTNKWCEAVKLTDFDEKIRSWDADTDADGNIKISAVLANINLSNGDKELNDTARLVTFDANFKEDIIVNSADVDESDAVRGGSADIDINVTNNSSQSIAEWNVIVKGDKAGELYNGTAVGYADPGETADISLSVNIPEDFVRQNVNISVTPVTTVDEDTSDNSCDIVMGEAKLDVSAEYKSDSGLVTVTVKNTGFAPLNALKLNITDETEKALKTENIASLDAGAEKSFDIKLDPSYTSFGSIYDHHAIIADVESNTDGQILTASDSCVLEPEPVDFITSDTSDILLFVGEKFTPELKLYPENAFVTKMYNTSSAPSVAEVGEDNAITAMSPGSAVISYMPLGSDFIYRINVETAYKGDVTGDGKTDKADAAAILRYTGRLMNFDERQREIGDVNNDGNVDTADAVAILRGLS